ncbi:YcxB family protein [Clostridium sp. J1101437_171009_A5]|uniref:YcxB family protein n=1 Tax=Clostridium sp. J1101437_171009_A5 TaxID=2787098 RepID=UPI001899DAAC|nr:YcxB family protein [Clostridium sp. J1101437_171009_A5]
MEIKIRTHYDRDALTAMARGLRKTVRRKKSRRSRIVGVVLMVLAFLFGAGDLILNPGWKAWLDLGVAVVLLLILLTEDRVNGFLAGRKVLPGARDTETVFTEYDYTTTIQNAETRWSYESIRAIAEGENFIVLALSDRHAQVFDKRGITAGTPEELRTLLRDKTGLPVTKM